VKSYFSKIFRYWMAVGHVIGLVMTPVHMFLVYVLVFGPANAAARVLRKDPLDRSMTDEPTFWRDKPSLDPSVESLRHTF